MHCFASATSILIIYLFSPTIAKEPVKLVEDDEFLAFVKDPSNFWQYILYEYLFRLYVEGVDAMLPNFKLHRV
uniref:Secreted protein n=1 Tax=Globodera pallida TaxID=36090 RepID=A0A183BMP0_GLOPA